MQSTLDLIDLSKPTQGKHGGTDTEIEMKSCSTNITRITLILMRRSQEKEQKTILQQARVQCMESQWIALLTHPAEMEQHGSPIGVLSLLPC